MRVIVAGCLLGVSAVAVAVAVTVGVWVSAAAVLAVVAGGVSARIITTEVRQTRRAWARDRAAQSQTFTEHLSSTRAEHRQFVESLSARIRQRDDTIDGLRDDLLLANQRADATAVRLKLESKRANDAQERLAAVLNEVLVPGPQGRGTTETPAAAVPERDLDERASVAALLAWEEHTDRVLTAQQLPREA